MRFSIPHDHPALPGHFPGRPVVPGVVLLERVLEAIELEFEHGTLAGLRLPQVKFARPLLPGEPARVELARPDPAAARWRFRVLRDDSTHDGGPGNGTLLASGEVVAS